MSQASEKKRALIVEDEPDLLDAMAYVIEKTGLTAVKATSAEEARAIMATEKFDAIFLDVNLPGENGLTFLASLHKQSAGAPLPPAVIVSSIVFQEDHKIRMMKTLGVQLFVSKPWNQDLIKTFLTERILEVKIRKYDNAIIEFFKKATIQTMQLNTQITPVFGTPELKEEDKTETEFTGIISLTGAKIKGVVSLNFERECVSKLARTMFQSPDMELPDSILSDVSGEMCNQVAGSVQKIFQKAGLRFEISTPTLITGSGKNVVHKIDAPLLKLPFKWENSDFYAEFGVILDEPLGEIDLEEILSEKAEVTPESNDSGEISFF